MGKINYGRVIIGAIIAGIFFFITDGVVHTVLGPYHLAALNKLASVPPQTQDPTMYIWFGLYDLCKGLAALLIYAGIRPRFGAGVKTAVWAGVITWLAAKVAPSLASMPFPFYDHVYFYKLMAMTLVTTAVGAIIGAAIYKE
jgi:hypothetical protein